MACMGHGLLPSAKLPSSPYAQGSLVQARGRSKNSPAFTEPVTVKTFRCSLSRKDYGMNSEY